MNLDHGTATTEPLAPERLMHAKHAYTTRHLDLTTARQLRTDAVPSTGDVVLARVAAIGQHTKIEQTDGRRATLFPGDEVVVVYGDRYAPDQFHASVPTDLGPCSLVAAGGIAAQVEAAHGRMQEATTLEPVGLLADAAGRQLNLRDVAAQEIPRASGPRPVTIAVVGTSMNSGKTTSAAYLVRGLRLAGLRVGAAKVTGTGAGGDIWLLSDAGAFPVYDFTLAGLPSTYRVGPAEVLRVFVDLTSRLALDGCDAVVIEVADGVFQQETAALLEDPVFHEGVDAMLFAAVDALGAVAGTAWLRERGLAPLALTGVLSASPLATLEAVSATHDQVWGLQHLGDPDAAARLYADLRKPGGVVTTDAVDPKPTTEIDLAARTAPEGPLPPGAATERPERDQVA